MKKIILLFSGIILNLAIYSHPWKPSHYVIVDTDGGIDDIRAITLLIASPDVRVLGITVSGGVLSPENAYIKVKSLLKSFYHEGIPIGIDKGNKFKSTDFPFALQTVWGSEDGIDVKAAPDNIRVISDILSAEKTRTSFICLGGLTTVYQAVRTVPAFRQQVKDIVWSADGSDDNKGFNYNIDKYASAGILKQEVPVKIVRSFDSGQTDFYDDELIRIISTIDNPYAKKISAFFSSNGVKGHKFSYYATDEMVSVFIQYPDFFINKTAGNISESAPSDQPGLRECYIRILKGETVSRNQVIREFPVDPEFYFDDIRPSVNEIISRYGIDEWTSGVLANELHRHLGVFAIIGVKMGIRAREYFNTGVDEFATVSYAGSTPPLSCMNDGLQVSTGSTPGHGLLTVRNDTVLSASAEFRYMNRKIRLILKPEISEKISSELREINFIYGLDSNVYWELVRKNTIKYWKDLDRHEIFEIEVMF
jgi:pyrimidine-specific ribonucleoside hydrolase